MDKTSQFYKIILLIVISIGLFLGLKYLLPDRLFPESAANDSSMLIDSVLLEALDGNLLVLNEGVLIDSVVENETDSESYNDISTMKSSTNSAVSEQLSMSALSLKPFKRS